MYTSAPALLEQSPHPAWGGSHLSTRTQSEPNPARNHLFTFPEPCSNPSLARRHLVTQVRALLAFQTPRTLSDPSPVPTRGTTPIYATTDAT